MIGTWPPELLLAATGLSFLIAGGLLVLLLRYMGGGKDQGKRRRESRPVEASSAQEVVRQEAEPAHRPEVVTDLRPVMRLLRDQEGRLVVEVEGQRYRHLTEIRDGGVGRQVVAIIQDLIAFAGPAVAVRPGAQQVASRTPTPGGSAEPPAAGEGTAPADPEAAAAFLRELARQGSPPPKRSRPLLSMDPVPFRRQDMRLWERPGIRLNLAEEIEAILQRRLLAEPALQDRQVHVTQAPDGTLRIQVDTAFYASPTEVPDPLIRRVLQEAIREWERSR